MCNIDGRLVTSADKYGTILTEIDVRLDRKTRDVLSAKAGNTIVRIDALARDAEQTKLIAAYDERAKPIASRPSGRIADYASRDPNRAGESVLGDIVADAQLAATSADANGGAVIAITNPGGIRNSIMKNGEGTVTYADVFASQPFRNQLVTMTLTGAQLKQALEQQWTAPCSRASCRSRAASLFPGMGRGRSATACRSRASPFAARQSIRKRATV